MAVKEIEDAQFEDALQSNAKVVIKFYADWCGSCKLFDPKFKRLSEKDAFKDVEFLNVNAEKNPQARKWAGVTNLPFFAVAREGQLVGGDFTAKEDGVRKLIEKLN